MNLAAVGIGVVSIAVAVVYLFVAQRLQQRPVAPPARLASSQFALWWFGLAATGVMAGIEGILGAVGQLNFPLAMTFLVLNDLIDCALLWGLVGYLTYLYTGKYYLAALSGFYALFYASVVYLTFSEAPYAVAIQSGTPTILYGATVHNPVLIAWVIFALIVPEFAAAILYFSLLRRTHDRTIRYRIILVSSSILLWFLIDASGSVGTGVTASAVRGILSAGAALLSLIAFYPPSWIQRRLRVSSVPGPQEGASVTA